MWLIGRICVGFIFFRGAILVCNEHNMFYDYSSPRGSHFMIAMEWFAVYERDAIEVKKMKLKAGRFFF